MTGADHYARAEQIVEALDLDEYLPEDRADAAARAQVHATLAQAAAAVETAAVTAAAHGISSVALDDWANVLAVEAVR